ncbi:hypothetical protein niasHS_001620 [Heterodera schachtii]|uniref:protein-tyrosine-phosphatase n=1 Tax=Heterodera schachtii TaxID=97005 RepID=A0ABD2KE00_HETSC
MPTNGSKGNDQQQRMVLSRHLAGEGTANRPNAGTSTDWLSITYPMGNLSSSLRRSMPSVNSSADGTGAGAEHLVQRVGTARHSSFSTEDGAAMCQKEQQQNSVDIADSETKRSISSHSLSPSGSTILNNNSSIGEISSRRLTANSAAYDFDGAASVVDTRQIKVFLKKREDSITTISSEMSDTLSVGKGPGPISGAGGAQSGAIPPAPPQLVHGHHSVALPRIPSRNVFRAPPSANMRSFSAQSSSVSSSLDSAKEEWLISNFDHANPSQRVMVLPRPASLHNDDYEEETAKTPVPFSTLSSPVPSLSLSAWHSVSDLTPSARTMVPEKGQTNDAAGSRRGSTPSGENGTGGAEKVQHSPPPRPPKRPQSQAGHRKSNYLGELVWQVDETVFCGGVEAVQNRNLLCRLNIEYIVDLSGQEDDPLQLNSRPRSEFPCLCSRRTAHSRMTMAMTLRDDSQQQMLGKETRPSTAETKAQLAEREHIVKWEKLDGTFTSQNISDQIRYFETLIDLIRKARISQKKVLIHSLRGRNRGPAFVAAYLMHCNRITRVQAINRITKLRALMRWQFILGIRAESSRLDSQSLNRMFAVKRNAWN